MNNYLKRLILISLCLCIISISSCSKDDGVDQVFEGKKLLQTIDGEFVSRHTYNSSGLMDSILTYRDESLDYYSLVRYSGNQITHIDDYYIDSEGNHNPDGGTELKYEKGLVSELIFPDGRVSFEYENGLCHKQEDYVDGQIHSSTSFTYENGNIISEERVRYEDNQFFVKIETNFTFDSRFNPESYLFQFIPGYPISKNNPLIRDQMVVESAEGIQYSVGDSKFDYEYDTDGYPIKETRYSGTNGENDWSLRSVTEYIYQ